MVAKVFCNEFSKSIFWAGVEEFFLIKNKSFILLNNMFRKNEKKKITAKKISLFVLY